MAPKKETLSTVRYNKKVTTEVTTEIIVTESDIIDYVENRYGLKLPREHTSVTYPYCHEDDSPRLDNRDNVITVTYEQTTISNE